MQEKQCFKCHRTLPLDEFYKHGMMGDGRLGKCKSCTREDVKAHRLANVEKARAYDRMRNRNDPKRKKMDLGKQRKKRAKEGTVYVQAHNAFARAVKAGKIIRPDHCSRCLVQCQPQGHHDDYNFPLDVMWLCPPCHAQRHLELGRLGKQSARKPAPGGVGEGRP